MACTLLLATGTASAATTIPSTVVSDPAVSSYDPAHVASVDAITTGWITPTTGSPHVEIRRTFADGSTSPVIAIPRSDGFPNHLNLELNYGGVVTALWNSFDGIQMSRIAADGTPGPVLDLGPAENVARPQAITDRKNRTTVVWKGDKGGRILSVRIAADGTPGPLRVLSKQGARSPVLAVGTDDHVQVAWKTEGGGRKGRRVQSLTILPSGKPERIRTLGSQATHPSIAVSVDNDTVVTWAADEGSSVKAAFTPSGGRRVRKSTLSADPKRRAENPVVAFGRFGTALVAWTSSGRTSSSVIAAQVDKEGPVSRARTVAAKGKSPLVAHLQGGSVLMAYSDRSGVVTQALRDGKSGVASQIADSKYADGLGLVAVGKEGSLTWERPIANVGRLQSIVYLARIPPTG